MKNVQEQALEQTPNQILEALVQRFSAALLDKLRASEQKYGWQNAWLRDDWMDECQHELCRHIEKGDPLDVAAFCAFLWFHQEPTASSIALPKTD